MKGIKRLYVASLGASVFFGMATAASTNEIDDEMFRSLEQAHESGLRYGDMVEQFDTEQKLNRQQQQIEDQQRQIDEINRKMMIGR